MSRTDKTRPFWVKVTDAHVLGSATVRGRPAWRVSFYDPGTPGWFTVLVDKTSLRIYQVRMTATAHFQLDRSREFGPRSMSAEAAIERSRPSARTAGTQRIPRHVQELQDHSWIRRWLYAVQRRRELHA